MKRKAIQLAKKTLVVSLPNKWVKRFNVQKGQEIEVEEKGNSLLLKANNEVCPVESKEFHHDKVCRLINRYLSKLYQDGVDEVKVNFTNPDVVARLKEKLREELGYEIIKQGQKYCVIKDISGQKYDEFQNSLNRLFLLVNNMFEDGIDALNSKDEKFLESLIRRDEDINKFSNFCLRMLTKRGCGNEHINFYLISTLERIGDEFKEMLWEVMDKKISVGKNELDLIKEINLLFYECYKFTLNPNIKKALEIADLYDSLKGRINSQKEGIKHHLKTITSLVVSIQEVQLRFIKDV